MVRHLLGQYVHYHSHFPFLHTPTISLTAAYAALPAAICCVGACYTDRVPPDTLRRAADLLHQALVAGPLAADVQAPATDHAVQEMQAFILDYCLGIFNGTPLQRQRCFESWPVLANRARQLGLFDVHESHLSPLHRQDVDLSDMPPFDWRGWIQQEERVRIAHLLLVIDTALGVFFNLASSINCFEIVAPLPVDDTAWAARSANDCAVALGLFGQERAREVGPDGTHRPAQPYSNHVLQALLHNSYDIQPGTTNLFGKFIVIHAVLALIRRAQVEGSTEKSAHGGDLFGYGAPPSGDLFTRRESTTATTTTPLNETGNLVLADHTMQHLLTILQKFKANWDADMARQFPPPTAANHPLRHGFSKDGVHFYWLAKFMLRNTRPAHLDLPPDKRFSQMMQMLKAVKAWVMSDAALRGEDLGSVGDVDADYAVRDLTVQMAGLFRPLGGQQQ